MLLLNRPDVKSYKFTAMIRGSVNQHLSTVKGHDDLISWGVQYIGGHGLGDAALQADF